MFPMAMIARNCRRSCVILLERGNAGARWINVYNFALSGCRLVAECRQQSSLDIGKQSKP